jgi:hypothetical protein
MHGLGRGNKHKKTKPDKAQRGAGSESVFGRPGLAEFIERPQAGANWRLRPL